MQQRLVRSCSTGDTVSSGIGGLPGYMMRSFTKTRYIWFTLFSFRQAGFPVLPLQYVGSIAAAN